MVRLTQDNITGRVVTCGIVSGSIFGTVRTRYTYIAFNSFVDGAEDGIAGLGVTVTFLPTNALATHAATAIIATLESVALRDTDVLALAAVGAALASCTLATRAATAIVATLETVALRHAN